MLRFKVTICIKTFRQVFVEAHDADEAEFIISKDIQAISDGKKREVAAVELSPKLPMKGKIL